MKSFSLIIAIASMNFNGVFAQLIKNTFYNVNNGLSTSGVLNIGFDEKNKLWINTRSQGLYSFCNGKFKSELLAYSGNSEFNYFLKDKNNLYFVAMKILNEKTFNIIHTIKDNKIKAIDTIINNQAQFFTFNCSIGNIKDSNYCFFQRSGEIICRNIDSKKEVVFNNYHLSQNSNFKFYNNAFYISTLEGVIKFTFKNKWGIEEISNTECTNFCIDIQNNDLYCVNKNKIYKYSNHKILFITTIPHQLNNEKIGIYCLNKQLYLYNLTHIWKYNVLNNNQLFMGYNNGLAINNAYYISSDIENNLWICSGDGLTKIHQNNHLNYLGSNLGLIQNEISTIEELNSNKIVIGNSQGFIISDSLNNQLFSHHFKRNSNRKSIFLDACKTPKGIAIAYVNGIDILKHNNTTYNLKKANNNTEVYYSLVSNNYKLFYSKSTDIYCYNFDTKRDELILKYGKLIRKIFIKNDSTIIICSVGGCFAFNLNTQKSIFLTLFSSYYYLNDSDSNTEYIGTSNGLYAIKNKKLIKPELQGYNTNPVYAVLKHHNYIYIGSNYGIIKWNLINHQISNINQENYLLGTEVNRSAFKVINNKIYIGTNGGLTILNENADEKHNRIPIYLKELNKSNNAIEFIFEFNTYNSNHNFSFYLDGFDSKWSIPSANNSCKYTNLLPGKYTLFAKSITNNHTDSFNYQYTFTIPTPWHKSIWFYAILGILLLILIYAIVKIKTNLILKKNKEKEILLNSQLNALKAQINTHFFSNTLQTAQIHLMNKNALNAGEILGNYSKLLRNTFNISNKAYISLSEEINFLDNYLKLQSGILDSNFKYSINAPKTIDLDTILIPSMLIQPYVENAINHGLKLLYAEKKVLEIIFELKDSEILCYIKDNGLGIIDNKKKDRLSGNTIIEERLKLYTQNFNFLFDVKIENLQPNGTQITINLPYKKNDN